LDTDCNEMTTALHAVDTAKPQKQRATKEYLKIGEEIGSQKWGQQDSSTAVEDGNGGSRQSCVVKSRLWPMLHWERLDVSQVNQYGTQSSAEMIIFRQETQLSPTNRAIHLCNAIRGRPHETGPSANRSCVSISWSTV